VSAHESKGAIFTSLAVNVGIGLSKIVAFLITGATSMLAEGIHSFVDSSNQILLLVGSANAKKAPTKTHPFGYGRAHFLYGFIVAIVLFTLGGIFAIYEGVHKIQDPHPTENVLVAYIVLAISITLEAFALRTVLKEARTFKPQDQTWWRFIRQTKSVNHIVLLFEDTAALTGLSFAVIGVTLSILTHNGVWDGYATVLIGLLLVAVASILFIEVKSLLIGEGADEKTVAIIRGQILAVEAVNQIIDLKTLYVGPNEMLITMKVAVDVEDSARLVANAIDEIEERIRVAVPAAREITVEPDIYRTAAEQVAQDSRIAALVEEAGEV
jgi:cation diffusion facilitator family transporter